MQVVQYNPCPLSFPLEIRGWSWNVACLSPDSSRFISLGCIAVGAADAPQAKQTSLCWGFLCIFVPIQR